MCKCFSWQGSSLTYGSHGGTNGHAILLQDRVVGPVEHIDSILNVRHPLRRSRNRKPNHTSGLGIVSAEEGACAVGCGYIPDLGPA